MNQITPMTRAELGQRILAILATGPRSINALRAPLDRSHTSVLRVLRGNLRGQVKAIGRAKTTQWALASYVEPPVQPKPSPIRNGGLESIVVLKKKYAKAKPAISDGPAWWTQYAAPEQRDAFIHAASARNAEMLTTYEWRRQSINFS